LENGYVLWETFYWALLSYLAKIGYDGQFFMSNFQHAFCGTREMGMSEHFFQLCVVVGKMGMTENFFQLCVIFGKMGIILMGEVFTGFVLYLRRWA
jgi:hypothetical protein